MERPWRFVCILLLLVCSITWVGCSGLWASEREVEQAVPEETDTPVPEDTPTPLQPLALVFWCSSPTQVAFWSEMARLYLEQHPDMTLQVQMMPNTSTPEGAIQAAITGGAAPHASDGVCVGFGTDLAHSEAIIPLDDMPGWQEVIDARSMGQTIGQWESGDGHTYVLPLHTSPVLWAWRTDLLGDASLPRTYDEVVAVGQDIRATRPDGYVWSLSTLRRDVWWEQWYDFLSLYYAASGGQPLVAGSRIAADDEAAVEALTLLHDLQADELLHTEAAADTLETGVSICGPVVPLTTRAWRYRFPELQMGTTYTLTVPPVPATYPAAEPVSVVADSRGVVIYAQSDRRERAAMWDFIRWVFTRPEHDLIWLQHTGLLPARDDLMTNELYRVYLDEHPQLVPYAESLPYVVLPLAHPNYAQIQTALGQEAVIPVLRGEKEPEQAWQDWKDAIQDLL